MAVETASSICPCGLCGLMFFPVSLLLLLFQKSCRSTGTSKQGYLESDANVTTSSRASHWRTLSGPFLQVFMPAFSLAALLCLYSAPITTLAYPLFGGLYSWGALLHKTARIPQSTLTQAYWSTLRKQLCDRDPQCRMLQEDGAEVMPD